jgi:pimeloyl-ACP methyl ester carboxylesterase
MLKVLLDHYQDLDKFLPFLHYWEVTGERFSPELLRLLLSSAKIKVVDVYGSTEATSVIYTHSFIKDGMVSSISHIISNTQIYILDEYMNVVPRGMSGELYVGGVGLARGYLNRPDLTAEKFVPNPFYNEENDASSLRLYKTGDLARYLEDGNIEFLGRIDNQIKVRGFRIEPGEIESVLESHRDIASVIVTAIEDEEKNKQIVAYIVPKDTSSFNKESEHISSADETFYALAQNIELTESLRVLAAEKLPEYMIPSFFVYIDRIPLNANGKADRKSLPAPDRSKRQVAEAYVEPTTEIEKVLVDIWKDVLKVEKVGIHDNFFKLGGHSLLAIQVASILKKNAIFISVLDIFNAQTVYTLANTIMSKNIYTQPQIISEISSAGSKTPLFLVHPSGGLSLCYQNLSQYIKDRPIYGINSPCFLNPSDCHYSLEEMASEYIKCIQKVQSSGPYLLGGWSFGGIVAWEMAIQLINNGYTLKSLILIDIEFAEQQNSSFNQEQNNKIPGFLKNMSLDSEYLKCFNDNVQLHKAKTLGYNLKDFYFNVELLEAADKDEERKQLKYLLYKKYFTNFRITEIPGQHNILFDTNYIATTAHSIRKILHNIT